MNITLYELADEFRATADKLADMPPRGFCGCGCGEKTSVAKQTIRKLGYEAGEPLRFVRGHRLDRSRPVSLKSRFAAAYKVSGSGCWVWQRQLNKQGYGSIDARLIDGRRKTLLAHRASYLLHFGGLPDDMLVCHKCDNPSCVNPNHLFLGTHQDNSDDKMEKGRDRKAHGESHPNAKLSIADIELIRRGAISLRQVAKQLGITFGHAGRIRRGELWRTKNETV